MLRVLTSLVLLGAVTAGVLLFMTRPDRVAAEDFAGLTGDAVRGETVFWAAGCASCHAAEDAVDEARLVLAGGQRFPSDFGTFVAPNISPDPEHGIGGWTLAEFADAVQQGRSPEGRHYYPAFPYTAYIRMAPQDVADLKAFMDGLQPSSNPSAPHELAFPFSIRQSVGVWKLLYLREDWVVEGDLPEPAARGRYLVEGLAHCGECHTPRTALGGLDAARWMAGAPNPSGRGQIPSINPAGLDWSENDIAYYLETGFTPDFDRSGGHMVAVIRNMAMLPPEDRMAIAVYLKALNPID